MGVQGQDNSFYVNYNSGDSNVSYAKFLVYNRGQLQTYLTNTSTGWVTTSDERLKTVLEPITHTLELLQDVTPVYYSYNADPRASRHIGLLAQEVEKVYPECVQPTPTGHLGVVYQELIPVLLSAIKELTARVAALELKNLRKKKTT